MTKFIYAKNRLINDMLLGIVPDGYTPAQVAARVAGIESYYGLECEVCEERRT